MKKDKNDYIIHKVIQALDILEQFHEEVAELGLSELSKLVGMSEASLNPMLVTLMARNYIEQNKLTKRFRLGYKNLELAQAVLRQTDLYRVSHPVLDSVAHDCGENCSVAVLRRSFVIELDSIQCDQPVQVVKRVGVHLPVYCTAAGKMLIAMESEENLEQLLNTLEMERCTPNTVTEPAELKLQLARIAEQGYAVDDQEQDLDVRGVAAPIRDYSGKVAGALVINGPSCRVTLELIAKELLPLVQKGAREISLKLGYHEAEPPVPQKAKPAPRPRASSRARTLH